MSNTEVKAAINSAEEFVPAEQRETTVEPKLSQRDALIAIGLEAEYWHNADHEPFGSIRVDGHVEHHRVGSKAFNRWLLGEYGNKYRIDVGGELSPRCPAKTAQDEALQMFAAKAAAGSLQATWVRVAGFEGEIFIDLGSPDWAAIRIASNGWEIVEQPPVKFLRPNGMREIARPVSGGSVDLLRHHLNLESDDDFKLVVAFCLAAMSPIGPYPILVVNGEQGSAKTTLCRALKRLLDPNVADMRSLPRSEQDMAISARNGRILAYDNLSNIKENIADSLCRISTGAGFSARTLYTDTEETIIAVARPQIINGIPDLTARADLADRSFALMLPPIAEVQRRSEMEFWDAFSKDAPAILGALCTAVSRGLRCKQDLTLPRLPRMADTARLVEAAAPELGWQRGDFLQVLQRSSERAVEATLEAEPLADAVIHFVEETEEWAGTATELLKKLNDHFPEARKNKPGWPKAPNKLSGVVRRIAPSLRRRGIEVETNVREGHGGTRIIKLRKSGNLPSAPSAPTAIPETAGTSVARNTASAELGDGGDGTLAKTKSEDGWRKVI